MPKKISKSSLKKKADILWAIVTKLRAGGKCEVCNKKSPMVRLNSHHIIGRKFLYFRHNVRNCVCLCASHHKFSPINSAHENPIWFHSWLLKNRAKDLRYLEANYTKPKAVDYNDAIKSLTKELDILTKKQKNYTINN